MLSVSSLHIVQSTRVLPSFPLSMQLEEQDSEADVEEHKDCLRLHRDQMVEPSWKEVMRKRRRPLLSFWN